MNHGYYADADRKSKRRIRRWYQDNLMNVLEDAKERRVRGVDASIVLAKQLLQILNEPVKKPVDVPLYDLAPYEDDKVMKPVPPQLREIIYGSTEKGSTEKYLKARNKIAPEDKCMQVSSRYDNDNPILLNNIEFNFRVTTSLDYGWQQKHSHVPARDVNRGRCAILRDTFYRKSNLAPDPIHYAQPSGGQISVCSEYSCNF